MAKINDGGPAFPIAVPPDFYYAVDGISVRDWFAGQALAGICATGPHDCGPSGVAADAYAQADAMLAERERQP